MGGHKRSEACILCLLWLLLAPAQLALAGSAFGVEPRTTTWEKVVFSAADAAVRTIAKQTGAQLSLRDVPLETLQVFACQRHHVGLSIDGIHYEIALGGEKELAAAVAGQRPALPPSTGANSKSTQLALEKHMQQQQQLASASALTLPDITLSGPLELVLQEPGLVSFFVPHAADVGALRRIRLGPGVTAKVAGLKSIMLRRPTELPTLPIGYLVDVYAQARLGVPEEGYNTAPGLRYLAEQLHQMALNSSSSLPLLSFEVAPAAHALSITSAVPSPGPRPPTERPPRLRVKRSKDGAVELTQPQLPAKKSSRRPSAAADDLANMGQLWAWPLPHVDMSALVPYETLFKSILVVHPFDLNRVSTRGISLQLTKSEVQGVRMLGFEIEVRSRLPKPDSPEEDEAFAEEDELEGSPEFERDHEQLLIFDVVMQVVEGSKAGLSSSSSSSSRAGAGGKGGEEVVGDWSFVPLSVKLKQVHGSTMTSDGSAVAALLGNDTSLPVPVGFESYDLGIAGQAAD